jgi:hypothetical protein
VELKSPGYTLPRTPTPDREPVFRSYGLGKRQKVSLAIEKRIQGLLRAKKGILSVAKECGVGTGAVQRIAREMAEVGRRPLDGASAAA